MAMGTVVRGLGRLFASGTATGMSEGQLLDRFVERRDEAAFEALVACHGPMVLAVCRRLLHDPNDVDDAFQATFLVLVRKAGSLRQRRFARELAVRRRLPRLHARRRPPAPSSIGIVDLGTCPRAGDRRRLNRPRSANCWKKCDVCRNVIAPRCPLRPRRLDPRGSRGATWLAGRFGEGPTFPRRELLRARFTVAGLIRPRRLSRRCWAVCPPCSACLLDRQGRGAGRGRRNFGRRPWIDLRRGVRFIPGSDSRHDAHPVESRVRGRRLDRHDAHRHGSLRLPIRPVPTPPKARPTAR